MIKKDLTLQEIKQILIDKQLINSVFLFEVYSDHIGIYSIKTINKGYNIEVITCHELFREMTAKDLIELPTIDYFEFNIYDINYQNTEESYSFRPLAKLDMN